MKWKKEGHLRAACLQHAQDLLDAAKNGSAEDVRKELADITIIFSLATEGEEIETLLAKRREKFQATAHLPPLG